MGCSNSTELEQRLEDDKRYYESELRVKTDKIAALEATVRRLENEVIDQKTQISHLEEYVCSKDSQLREANAKIGTLGKLISSQNENIRKLKLNLSKNQKKSAIQNQEQKTHKANKQNRGNKQQKQNTKNQMSSEKLDNHDNDPNYDVIVFNMEESDDHYMDILQVENFMRQLTGKSIKCLRVSRLGAPREKARPIKVQLSSSSDTAVILRCKDKTKNLNCYQNVNVDEYVPLGQTRQSRSRSRHRK